MLVKMENPNGGSSSITDLPKIISTQRSYDNASNKFIDDFSVETQGYGTLSNDKTTFTFSKACKCIVFLVAGDVTDGYASGTTYDIYKNGTNVDSFTSGSVTSKLVPKAIPMDFNAGDTFKVYYTALGQYSAWCVSLMAIE